MTDTRCWRYRLVDGKVESKLFDDYATVPDGWADSPAKVSSESSRKTQAESDIKDMARFTRESLQAVFDADGMKGLRMIGKLYNVKSRAKDELIDDILGAQNDSESSD